ncbi:hypothetical protein ACTFIW_002494 [Dictyostelium discoideum]|uniref:UBC core domain-containing protein n=1 Tax=Dictyostelium discoideum TaxID=44689 RepID=Q54VW9_DICDI|nr:hypothetical protein DDB_G0280091 [Dictyostelium discoideum AX4]EAL67272.1 hypothetical protein DDB_G0280091 [Dictyostelium discoideum AX4]|eukprot:XP_641236.1 hypothetical protein DDB_G0280091 [Dictyostelium discoideum AX4]
MSSPNRRRDLDLTKLMMSDYEVTMDGDSMAQFFVKFKGPSDSPYFGGCWKVRVELPPAYPYKSPSIGFTNKIYHPNVDLASGSVCLDVINQTWSPMFDLINIFEIFLPQLLLYPNPTDPLNGEAASMLLKEPEKYKIKVKEFVNKYASDNSENDESESESDLSSYSDSSDNDDNDNNEKFPIDDL